jgi:D-beta-D-heptose 7-phosphate kinase/D-beta-D-heptose 1-phosphate adenosyltransferase
MRSIDEKIVDRAALAGLRRRSTAEGLKVVFTNGCFDLLHVGHVRLLVAARARGDLLVVGLNRDASVRRLKGPTRPVVAEADRAAVLCGLEAVDVVTLFDEDTPLEAIVALRPDVLVKGGDYQRDAIVGAREVIAWGGEVFVFPTIAGRSTTGLLASARQGA